MANRFEGQIEWLIDDEDLWRQIPRGCMTGGEPNSSAFNPSKEHHFILSTARQWLTAKGAYEQYTRKREDGTRLESQGTWALRVSVCNALQLFPYDDSKHVPSLDPGHVSIPFVGTPDAPETNGSRRRKAQALRDYALSRGCEYRPPAV